MTRVLMCVMLCSIGCAVPQSDGVTSQEIITLCDPFADASNVCGVYESPTGPIDVFEMTAVIVWANGDVPCCTPDVAASCANYTMFASCVIRTRGFNLNHPECKWRYSCDDDTVCETQCICPWGPEGYAFCERR